MKLVQFGKLMKINFGSIGGELLNKLYNFYIEDQKSFENIIGKLEEIGTKGCFLYEDKKNSSNSFIVFGIKYLETKYLETKYKDVKKEVQTIAVKGKILARGKDCSLGVGTDFNSSTLGFLFNETAQFKVLDSPGLITTISDLDLITNEKNR